MKIFIGCSASKDIDKSYYDLCKPLVEEVLKENDLVFGACHSGLMALTYDIAKSYRQKVIAICPERYIDDLKEMDCDEEIITKKVNERTDALIENSDILLFLPGGIGTTYELLTAIEAKRCHDFDKPIIIYNPNHFYDHLIDFFEKLYEEKIAYEKDKKIYTIVDSKEEVLSLIKKCYNK